MKKLYTKKYIFDKILDFCKKNPQGVLEIVGPTASGKTDISVEIAHFLKKKIHKEVEIISIDSRQVYKECDVSSAKITKEEMQDVKHHGLDLVNLDESYNVVKFQKYAFKTIQEILDKDHIPMLCGGTALWMDAVSENYIFSEEIKSPHPPLARRGEKQDNSLSQPLPEGEVTKFMNFEKSQKRGKPLWKFLKIGLYWERQKQYERINYRAHLQFKNGMIEEAQYLLEKYGEPLDNPNILEEKKISKNAFMSFGYLEIKDYLDGKITLERCIEINQQRNRKYAKRQRTWWRGRDDVIWLDMEKEEI